MKKLTLSILFCICLQFGSFQVFSQTVTLSGNITSFRFLSNDTIYLLDGFVYIKDGGILFIEAGTIIKGIKSSQGSLICTTSGTLLAQGTAEQPIVFTSNEAPGSRAAGDWGGIIILGEAPINVPGGVGIIEGGVDTPDGDGQYGGEDPNDVSGGLQYVRIEYAGIAYTPGNEINGLTLGGVGNGTLLDHIMVYESGDDAIEWFGGTVNAKYLVTANTLDDDFDTDFGWSGNVQFAVALHNPNYADVSGSNGFESDNDGTGSSNTPYTSGVFSNVTIAGPIHDAGDVINPNFKRGAQIRRNSRLKIFNSAIMGYPSGLMVDGTACEDNAIAGTLKVKNTFLAGNSNTFETAAGSTFDIESWFNTAGFNNATYTTVSELGLNDPFNSTNPDFRPGASSPLLTSSSFSDSDLDPTFFSTVAYSGAFGEFDNWMSCWTNFNPQTTDYSNPGSGTVTPTTAYFSYEGVGDSYEVQFENLSTGAESFYWDFGIAAASDDTSTLENPSFIYPAVGSYEVTLIAFGCINDTAKFTINVDTGGIQPGFNDPELFQTVIVYPNPILSIARIKMQVAEPIEVTLSVYNISGSLMKPSENLYLYPGEQVIEQNLQDLPSGFYFFDIESADGKKSIPIIKQ